MTTSAKPTRQKQILREAVWFGSFTSIGFPTGVNGRWFFVTTDANEVELNLEFVSETPLTIKLWKTPTINFAGVNVTPQNMRQSSGASTSVLTKGDGTISSAANEKLSFDTPAFWKPDINPFKEENGMILESSNAYGIQIINIGPNAADVTYSWFFNEIT